MPRDLEKYFNYSVNGLEDSLATWYTAVLMSTANALLFTSMAVAKKPIFKRQYAGFLAAGMMVIAWVFAAFALYNFVTRSNYVKRKATEHSHELSAKKIGTSQMIYGLTTLFFTVLVFFIVFLVLRDAWRTR